MLECSLASDLECSYSHDKFGYYKCMTMNLKLEKDNALIESVKGQHLLGKEQICYWIKFDNTSPKFKNCTFL